MVTEEEWVGFRKVSSTLSIYRSSLLTPTRTQIATLRQSQDVTSPTGREAKQLFLSLLWYCCVKLEAGSSRRSAGNVTPVCCDVASLHSWSFTGRFLSRYLAVFVCKVSFSFSFLSLSSCFYVWSWRLSWEICACRVCQLCMIRHAFLGGSRGSQLLNKP